MNKHIPIAVRILVVVLLLAFFAIAIYMSFIHLLRPKDRLNSKTLYSISNPYKEATALKGMIYDKNGTVLMKTVPLDNDGNPIIDDSESFISSQVQEDVSNRRALMDSEFPECWSNILSFVSANGLDTSLDGILQDIPLNEEDDTNVTLTIDRNVQSAVYDILENHPYSSAVIMRCGSGDGSGGGDIISMVSRPSFNFNEYRSGAIPYTTYVSGDSFCNNVDNAHNCTQDYYGLWKKQVTNDRTAEMLENMPKLTEDWLKDLYEKSLAFTEEGAQNLIDYWNETNQANFSLTECITIDFEKIYQEEKNFYETHTGNENFQFTYEPEKLGNGTDYVPFVKLALPEGTASEYKYLKLCYGNSNFIYEDCKENNFDPNFSLLNMAMQRSQPGSCFKILLSALLLDEADENLLKTENGIQTLNVQTNCTESGMPLPTVETATHSNQTSLAMGLAESSNYYFAMTAMELSKILQFHGNKYVCTYKSITELTDEEILASGAQLFEYYKRKFNINSDFNAYFSIPQSRILTCLDTVKIAPKPEDKSNIYERGVSDLWYEYDENDDLGQPYFENNSLMKKAVGDTAYGQGYDQISPIYMASVMGKCVTGKMYVPNVISDLSNEPQTIGEPFDRESQTVDLLRQNLEYVYDSHNNGKYIPEGLSFPVNAFHYYSKTGTASFDKGAGTTQSTYGLFGEKEGYHAQYGKNSYQVIWYVSAVSDGTNTCSIVLRSFFDDENRYSSYSLQREFLKIVDVLYQNHYLNA